MRRIVVFDVDDILWGLNAKVSEITGIPEEKLITFALQENPLLTDEEKERVMSIYMSSEQFRDIKWYPGVERIMSLEQYGAEVHINSNSISQEVVDFKYSQLKSVIDIPDERLHLNLINIGDSKKKDIGDDVFIFVDDSPHNIATSTAKYNLMLNHPWNTSVYGIRDIGNVPVVRFDSLEKIIDHIETLLKQDNELMKHLVISDTNTKFEWFDKEDPELYKRGVTIAWMAGRTTSVQRFIESLSYHIGYKCDFSWSGGRAHIDVLNIPDAVTKATEAINDSEWMSQFLVPYSKEAYDDGTYLEFLH